MRQKASAADIAKSLGRRVGSVKAKVREMGLVPLKKSRAKDSRGSTPRALMFAELAWVGPAERWHWERQVSGDV